MDVCDDGRDSGRGKNGACGDDACDDGVCGADKGDNDRGGDDKGGDGTVCDVFYNGGDRGTGHNQPGDEGRAYVDRRAQDETFSS